MVNIHNKQHIRNRAHFLDAAKAALEFFLFARETENFFLGKTLKRAVFGHLLKRRQSFYRLSNRFVVGQHTAKPTLTDKRHFATLGMHLHGVASGTLGANKKNFSAIGDRTLNEGTGLARKR